MSSFLKRATTLKKSTEGNKNATTGKLKHFDAANARPSDQLSSRANQYKHILKAIISYYEAQKDVHTNAAKQMLAQSQAIPVPFHEGDTFLQDESGYQHAFYQLRDHSKILADLEQEWANSIDTQVLEPLNTARSELKTLADNIDTDFGKTADAVDTERQASSNAIAEHAKGIAVVGSNDATFTASSWKNDPFITNKVVARQLAKQLDLENKLTRSTISYQRDWEAYERKLTQIMNSAHKQFRSLSAAKEDQVKVEHEAVEKALTAIEADAEWTHFANPEHGRILDPNTPLRDPNLIQFPHQDHPASTPIKTGDLLRKKRFTKRYGEYAFVLTQAGFMHEYPSSTANKDGIKSNDPKAMEPALSLYLPDLVLGPPSQPLDRKHKFYLTGKTKAAAGKESAKGLFSKSETNYTFKARSHADMMSWWEALSQHVKTAMSTAGSETASTHTRSVYAETVSHVGLPQSDAESGFTHPAESSEYLSSTGHSHMSIDEKAPSEHTVGKPASEHTLPSALALPVATHPGREGSTKSQDWDSDGSSVEEEEVHHPAQQGNMHDVLVAAAGPSTTSEVEPSMAGDGSSFATAPLSYAGSVAESHTETIKSGEAHFEGLPLYVGDESSAFPIEKKTEHDTTQ